MVWKHKEVYEKLYEIAERLRENHSGMETQAVLYSAGSLLCVA